jgi:hypothetical protein
MAREQGEGRPVLCRSASGREKMLTKRKILGRATVIHIIGYTLLLFIIVGDEVLDIPHFLFRVPPTPVNIGEIVFETAAIVVLGIFFVRISYRQLKRIRFLEGVLPICSVCKKFRSGDDWMTLEEYMLKHSEARLTHGICPECAEDLLDQ